MHNTIPSSLANIGSSFGRALVSQPCRKEHVDGGMIITRDGHIYKLLSVIATGGLSVVYRATRFSDGMNVALKLADSEKAAEATELLRKEAEILSQLDHPGIVKLIDHGETIEGDPFLAMELLSGLTLEQLLATDGKAPLCHAAYICRQVADALEYAHDKGIIHRDIKPSNVIVCGNRVVIVDFGIAVRLEQATAGEKRQSSSGSLLYAAPEQLYESRLSPATDTFQLALVILELMTGTLPFEVSVSGALAYRKRGPLIPDNELLGSARLSLPVRTALEHALSRNPRLRTQSAASLAAALERALAPAAA